MEKKKLDQEKTKPLESHCLQMSSVSPVERRPHSTHCPAADGHRGPRTSSHPALRPGAPNDLVGFVWDIPAGNTTQSGACSQPPPSRSLSAFPRSQPPVRAPDQLRLMLIIRLRLILCLLTYPILTYQILTRPHGGATFFMCAHNGLLG